jgi:hypothetical protein
MRNFLFFAIFFISINVFAEDIHSLPYGGKWESYSTWFGGKIPTKDDNVVLMNNITISSPIICKNLLILKSGSLTIKSPAKKSYKVEILEKLRIEGGILTIEDKCNVKVGEIIKTPDSEVHNSGILEVGK